MKRATKNAIVSYVLKQEPSEFTLNSQSNYITLLDDAFNLKKKKASDFNFESAFEELNHLIQKKKISTEDILTGYLNIFRNTVQLKKFLYAYISPQHQKSNDEILNHVSKINNILAENDENLRFAETTAPIRWNTSAESYTPEQNKDSSFYFRLYPKELVDDIPRNNKFNRITFNIDAPYDGHNRRRNVVPPLKDTGDFTLHFNGGWNDYGHRTIFDVVYQDESNDFIEIGSIKIIQNDPNSEVIHQIPSKFTNLSSDFCSMATSPRFYSNLKRWFKDTYLDILYALKDVAFYPNISEKFEEFEAFKKSIMRGLNAPKILRHARREITNISNPNFFGFQYHFIPPYSKESLKFNFDFEFDSKPRNRIYALIGENGTGKTQFMSSLPVAIEDNEQKLFSPHIPYFSKIIAVSYSAFDDYKIPKKNASFNYHHCGLRKDDGTLYSRQGLLLRFQNTRKSIEKKRRVDKWRSVLIKFIDENILNLVFIKKTEIQNFEHLAPLTEDELRSEDKYIYRHDEFLRIRRILSSGQSVILYVITEIVANLKLDSLILYDEPETHLHPNAITRLINAIYELVDEFESYCIIATHSPLVIREIPSRNVYIMKRVGNFPSVQRIGVESFGENIAILTDEVFGNKTAEKQHRSIINELVDQGLNYEEIIQSLETDIPLGLNASLFIKSSLLSRNEESIS